MACPNSDTWRVRIQIFFFFFFFFFFFARVADEFSEVARDARDTRILHWREGCMQQGCTCMERLFDTLANHRTHNTRPHCHLDWRMGIGCAMVAERLVPCSRTDTGNSHANTVFTLEKTAASAHAVKGLIMDVWL